MDKYEAVLGYKTAISVFKGWVQSGVINDGELQKINKIIAEKYGISLCSIYRENP